MTDVKREGTRVKKQETRIEGRITQWSFSRWSVHSGERGCPYRAYLKFVRKLTEPQHPAMARGDMIHKTAQGCIELMTEPTIPDTLVNISKEIKRLRKLNAQAEVELALTDKWVKTGWFDSNTWVRIKIDAIASTNKSQSKAEVIDWKSGKFRPDNEEYKLQLELYGAGVLSGYPYVKEVKTRLVFTDQDQKQCPPVEEVYSTKHHLDKLIQRWEGRIRPVLADTRFTPRPGFYCRTCHFRKDNGGPCQY